MPAVFGGVAEFPVARAAAMLRYLEQHGDELPDAVSLSLVVGRTTVLLRGVCAGTEADGPAALAPLRAIAGEPISDSFRAMPYRDVVTVGGTPPRDFAMVPYLSDALISDVVDTVTRPGSAVEAVEIRHRGGAIARPDHPAPGPVSHRDALFVLKLNGPADARADHPARDRRLVPQLPRRHHPHAHRVRAGRPAPPAGGQGRLRPDERLPPRARHPGQPRTVRPTRWNSLRSE